MCFKKDYPPYRPSGYNIAIINGLLFSPRGTHTHTNTQGEKKTLLTFKKKVCTDTEKALRQTT